MLESLFPLAMATHKMCPSLSSTSQKHHVCQMRLILPWSVVGTEGERFTLYLLCKNIMFLEVTRQAAVGGYWKNSSARLGVNMLPIVFELEPCHRNERKKRKVLEVVNLGHSLQLGWCLCSGRGHVGWKDLSSPLQPCVNLAPHTCWGHGQCCGCSHVSMEQVALAGKLLGDAKDSASPGPPLVVFFHLPVLACQQAQGHGGTHCWQCPCHVLFNPSNPKSPGGSGVAGDPLLLN